MFADFGVLMGRPETVEDFLLKSRRFPPTLPPTQVRNNLVLTGTSVDQKRTLQRQKEALSQENGTF